MDNNNDINSEVVAEEVKNEVKEEEKEVKEEENKEVKNEEETKEVKNEEEGQEAGTMDLIREYVAGEEFKALLREVISQVLSETQEPEQEPETVPEPENAVAAERERVSALLDNADVVDHATLRDYVANGRTVADLAMHVLAAKKEEIARNKASIISKCESETPIQCVSDRRREETTHENSKENVRNLLVNLGLR